jgi:glycosidase
VHYLFRVSDGTRQYWFGEEGLSLGEPDTFMTAGYFHRAYIHQSEVYDTPLWARQGVVYQVFVDRFRNGDPSNDPPGTVPWGTPPTGTMRAGGDLKGVIDSLDYLADLGIATLYLTPIFMAHTNHKYDTVDYTKVDPWFGDEHTLRRLLDGAHARGMHVVLDAVFNHCGTKFKPWVDVCRKQERSRYKDWFHIHAFPVDPHADEASATFEYFGNHPYLPKLNTQNAEVREYLLGVAKRWTRFGIDGFRLDAANEVDHAFWRDLRSCVRSINPEALLLAEIWHEATQFVQPGQIDGLTHFPFLGACRGFIAYGTLDAAQCVNRLTRARVPYQEQAVLWNVLGTHDTPRFLTECRGDKRKMRLALTMQMTYIGVPHIYYGDEIGLGGELDPGCRGCMEWDPVRQDHELHAHVRRLIALRAAHSALRSGNCITLAADRGSRLLAYVRRDGDDAAIIAINAGRRTAPLTLDESVLKPHRRWRDALSDLRCQAPDGAVQLELEPWQGVVLVPA